MRRKCLALNASFADVNKRPGVDMTDILGDACAVRTSMMGWPWQIAFFLPQVMDLKPENLDPKLSTLKPKP